jgi:hypothetical protein
MKTPLISRQIRFLLLTGAAILVVAAWAIARPTSPQPAPPAYQYVGLDRTLVRVEQSTGRIWVLRYRGSGQLSLLTSPAEPGWAWQEVRIETDDPTTPLPRSGR